MDDGSTDATAEIAGRYACRVVQVPNGGLSRARNIGIRAATGEFVAFIDSDAAADPDWLYFLVTQMVRQGAAACGGPNLSPPGDPEAAQRVDRAPGNPVQVLVDNELAEHIPGCNMAFRKRALEAIGGFNPVYRTAGDDVDVCWSSWSGASGSPSAPRRWSGTTGVPRSGPISASSRGTAVPRHCSKPGTRTLPSHGGRFMARQRL